MELKDVIRRTHEFAFRTMIKSMLARPRLREALLRTLLVLGSILFCLLALEIGLRLTHGPQWLVEWPNIITYQRAMARAHSDARAQPDPVLGFIGIANYASPDFHYDARSFRLTPAPAGVVLKEPPILAVGGSYTLGDEVADAETFPTQLQRLTARRVINAGMSAYGLDQAVLRAEIVAPQVKPAVIVLSFGANNLGRNEMSRVWGAEKPYFEQVGGELVLRNVPVPPSPDPATTLDFWQRVFGRSLLVDFVMRHTLWQYEWALDHARVLPRGEGARLSCPLFKRLARLSLPVVVVAEYDPYLWTDARYMREQKKLVDLALRCAEAAGFLTVDPFAEIDTIMRTAGRDALYKTTEHPNPAGHAFTARIVMDALKRLDLP